MCPKGRIIMRKTKIICTIGPACDDPRVFAEMCDAGMNVARLNFSHGTHEDHQVRINMIKKVRSEKGLPIAILLDTKGPEYRIRTFKNGEIFLRDGDEFTLTTREIEGDNTIVSVSYKNLHEDLDPGDTILINNGLVKLLVSDVDGTEIHCKVLIGGKLSNRKSMAFPGKVLKQIYLSEQDKADLLFGIQNGIDFVAASFVSSQQDVKDVRTFLNDNGGHDIEIIAKIENQSGIDNIREICDFCEGVMVARGDLGVEVDYAKLPSIQKRIITECRLLGKRVITATEMLESIIYQPRPTRAEISDVANAVYDGTSAVMLSGETAAGKYPVMAVKTMGEIAFEAEQNINYREWFINTSFKITSKTDAISHSVCGMAMDVEAKAIAVSSLSGATVRMISRFRAPVDILGIAVNERVWYRLSLSWGVTPVMSEKYDSTDVLFFNALNVTKEVLGLKKGDIVIMTGGKTNGVSGNTNLIKIENV